MWKSFLGFRFNLLYLRDRNRPGQAFCRFFTVTIATKYLLNVCKIMPHRYGLLNIQKGRSDSSHSNSFTLLCACVNVWVAACSKLSHPTNDQSVELIDVRAGFRDLKTMFAFSNYENWIFFSEDFRAFICGFLWTFMEKSAWWIELHWTYPPFRFLTGHQIVMLTLHFTFSWVKIVNTWEIRERKWNSANFGSSVRRRYVWIEIIINQSNHKLNWFILYFRNYVQNKGHKSKRQNGIIKNGNKTKTDK